MGPNFYIFFAYRWFCQKAFLSVVIWSLLLLLLLLLLLGRLLLILTALFWSLANINTSFRSRSLSSSWKPDSWKSMLNRVEMRFEVLKAGYWKMLECLKIRKLHLFLPSTPPVTFDDFPFPKTAPIYSNFLLLELLLHFHLQLLLHFQTLEPAPLQTLPSPQKSQQPSEKEGPGWHPSLV